MDAKKCPYPPPLEDSLEILRAVLKVEIHKGKNEGKNGRRDGLMVSGLISGSSSLGFSPGRGHCIVFLAKALLSQCLSPPRCINGYQQM